MTLTVLEPETAAPIEQAPTKPDDCRRVQTAWASLPIERRLLVLRRARHELARAGEQLVDAISSELVRIRADSYGAEVLPVLFACKFLERRARQILKPRRLGRSGLPLLLAGIDSTVERVPLGIVLIIGPSNYPLFLAGVQTLQALAAGNAVVWKPGRGGQPVAEVFHAALHRAGLPNGLLRITDESIETTIAELKSRPDKVFFTGSARAGREVLRIAAEATIPVVAELSGCDAVVVLESAKLDRVVDALAFGMRLNGSATCMAPRRLFLVGKGHEVLVARLRERFATMDGIDLDQRTRSQLRDLVAEAEHDGATLSIDPDAVLIKPLLVLDGWPRMRIAQADIFAPVLTVILAADADEVVQADKLCPFGLAVTIFGEERAARALGARLDVGTVVVNDLIVTTVDPRVPFGGRRGSGFGVTRGSEGLLEMTAVKVTSVRKSGPTLHFEKTSPTHEHLFRGAIAMSNGTTLRERLAGIRGLASAARRLLRKTQEKQ